MKQVPATKTLILVMGVAGTGKTTVAQQILQHVAAAYINKDVLTQPFVADSRESAEYKAVRPKIYQQLDGLMESNLSVDNSVLLDAPHVKEMQLAAWRDSLNDLVNRTQSRLAIIRCQCDENVLHDRLKKRAEGRDQWKLDNWDEFLKQEPIDVDIPFEHVDVDTTQPDKVNVQAIVEYVLGT